MVLKEVLLGETVAVKAYEKTLKKDLSPETREMLERQFDEVLKVVEQVRLLKGQNGKRLVLRLYDSKSDAEEALQTLKRDGFSEKAIETVRNNSQTSFFLDLFMVHGKLWRKPTV